MLPVQVGEVVRAVSSARWMETRAEAGRTEGLRRCMLARGSGGGAERRLLSARCRERAQKSGVGFWPGNVVSWVVTVALSSKRPWAMCKTAKEGGRRLRSSR